MRAHFRIGKIGNHEISRLIMGGNLIGGWAHSRDLLYVSSLFRAYNTERKILRDPHPVLRMRVSTQSTSVFRPMR
ncbi:MAG: hypothetical protein MZV63_50020 [Marinilabiliales bacterium]|nr:hypothetical protein [Marinilabiliales bacterium]